MDAEQVHRRLCDEAEAERRKERDQWEARRGQERTRDWMILSHLRALFGR